MRRQVLLTVSFSFGLLFVCGCAVTKEVEIITTPKGATLEAKMAYVPEVPGIGPPYNEDPYYTYIGQTPTVARFPFSELMGAHYIRFRISKPGFYLVERTYQAASVPDKIELELEKIE